MSTLFSLLRVPAPVNLHVHVNVPVNEGKTFSGTGTFTCTSRFTGDVFNIVSKLLLFSWLVLLVACQIGPKMAAPVESIPALEVIPERWQLANGLTVMFIKDDELPVVSANLILRGGRLWESPNEVGASTVMGGLLRSGGAGNYSPDALDRTLEELSASIGSSFGVESGGVSFFALKQDVEKVFDLFGQVVLKPRFDSQRLELSKLAIIDNIKKRREEPDLVTHIVATQLTYENLPYGQVMTSAGIAHLNRANIISVYNRFVQPRDAILTVSGNIDRATVEKLVERTFGGWHSGASALAPLPEIKNKPRARVVFVNLPITQASVELVQLGAPRHSPDAIAIDLSNHILGSGFGSRLMQKIRTELGLAYVVGGGVGSGPGLGMTAITLQTKAASTGEAIVAVYKLLDQMRKAEPSRAEVELNVRSVAASFIFQFESPGEIVSRRASQEFFGYPEDFDRTYLSKLRAITPQEVRAVAEERMRTEDFLVIVAGDETAYASLQAALADLPESTRSKGIERLKFNEAILP